MGRDPAAPPNYERSSVFVASFPDAVGAIDPFWSPVGVASAVHRGGVVTRTTTLGLLCDPAGIFRTLCTPPFP